MGMSDSEGPSLTYDIGMAWSFAGRAEEILDQHIRWDDVERVSPGWQKAHGWNPDNGSVLEFDPVKLARDHKIVHFHDDDLGRDADEMEVRPLTASLLNLDRYPVSFSFYVADIAWYEAYEKLGLWRPSAGHDFGVRPIADELRTLTRHPLFRAS